MQTSRNLPWGSGHLRGEGTRSPLGLAPAHGGGARRVNEGLTVGILRDTAVRQDEGPFLGILRDTAVCELAPSEAPAAWAMSLGYGYHDGLLYCHAEPDGWQVSVIRQHPEVRFVIEPKEGAAAVPVPRWPGQRVVGTGWAGVVEDADGKREGLDLIMAHYGRPGPLLYEDEILRQNAVIRVTVRQWCVEPVPPGPPATGPEEDVAHTGSRPG